jgi:peptide/nickel transport system substrate-binding protein
LESWEHSEDYTEWTFHLRQDVKWHDGEPVTARDVKFTLEMITNPKLMYESRFFEEITIINDFTCRLRSERPFNPLIYSWYGMCPEHLLGGLDIDDFFHWEFWKQPVGNGPYRYVRHVPDIMVGLEVNPDYYREKPKIERIILKFGKNRVTELLSGDVDAASLVPSSEVMGLRKDPRFNIYHEFRFSAIFSIIWNHQNPLFIKAASRRAITLAINRRELHQLLHLPDDTPILDTAITPGQFFRGELPEPVPYDPDEAKRLLSEEGWIDIGKEGVREKNGQEFRFTLYVGADQMSAAVYIQNQLREVGIHMEIVSMERGARGGRRQEGNFDAILSGFGPVGYDWGFGGYVNPEFEQLLKTAYWSLTVDEHDSSIRNVWPIFQKDLPWLFLYPQVNFNVVHKRIQGLKSPNRIYPAKFMEHLWIEEEE